MRSTSLSYEHYSNSDFVRQYEESIIGNAWNACYERPSTLSLLPPKLEGLQVLDAGCGPGVVTEWLLRKGAIVTAVDYSEEMIKRTRVRTKNKANAVVIDMNDGLYQLPEKTFDIIYASLVIHYIDDILALFGEFARVLKTGGLLVFSTDHPDVSEKDGELLSQRQKSVFWEGFNVNMQLYQRPWAMITEALKINGFQIEVTRAASPTEECREKFPDQYKILNAQPHFVCVGARSMLA